MKSFDSCELSMIDPTFCYYNLTLIIRFVKVLNEINKQSDK